MKHNASIGVKQATTSHDDARQQVRGGKPIGNPMALTKDSNPVQKWSDLTDSIEVGTKNGDATKAKLLRAFRRDAEYASGGAVFLRSFGMRQLGSELCDQTVEQTKTGIA